MQPDPQAQPAATPQPAAAGYRGRIAPTPTGLLHLGHAHTFYNAWQRARAAGGTLIYRQEDPDPMRCTEAFAQAAIADLRRYGLDWDEGPDCTPQGPHAPYCQSRRTALYRSALARLIRSGHAYPSPHSRSDLARALASGTARPAPPLFGEQDGEAIFPTHWRAAADAWFDNQQARERCARHIETETGQMPRPNAETVSCTDAGADLTVRANADALHRTEADADLIGHPSADAVNWRFRVPDGQVLHFTDASFGGQSFTAGTDFGDFVLWRRDGVPAYELAVVADDIAMGITEVVRGADLLRSTARQLLLYKALGATPPAFCHCPLVLDPQTGNRLAKRSESLSLRALLDSGAVQPISGD